MSDSIKVTKKNQAPSGWITVQARLPLGSACKLSHSTRRKGVTHENMKRLWLIVSTSYFCTSSAMNFNELNLMQKLNVSWGDRFLHSPLCPRLPVDCFLPFVRVEFKRNEVRRAIAVASGRQGAGVKRQGCRESEFRQSGGAEPSICSYSFQFCRQWRLFCTWLRFDDSPP